MALNDFLKRMFLLRLWIEHPDPPIDKTIPTEGRHALHTISSQRPHDKPADKPTDN